MWSNVYFTGITAIATFVLLFLGGNTFEFIYKSVPHQFDWIFWAGMVVSLICGLITIRNWFKSPYRRRWDKVILFSLCLITTGILLILGFCIAFLAIFGFPPQD